MADAKFTTMFYLVTKTLAAAMRRGTHCGRGTVYGVFATREAADAYAYKRKLSLVAEVVEQ